MISANEDLRLQTRDLLVGVAMVLASCLVITVLAAFFVGGYKAALLGLGWALAFFFPSFIIGMLFGVPKRRADPGSGKPAAPAAVPARGLLGGLELNPNFEQISDWVTKMITGVTLVSAKSIPDYCYRAGVYVGYSLGGVPDMKAASAGSFIVVLFCGLGFVCGYVFTSTYFTRLLDMTVRTLNKTDELVDALTKEGIGEGLRETLDRPAGGKGASGGSVGKLLPIPKPEEALLADIPVDMNASAESLELLGIAKFRAGRSMDAMLAFKAAIERDPSRYRSYQGLGNVLFNMGRYADAVSILERGREYIKKETEDRLYVYYYYDLLVCYCLYLDPPESYRKTLKYADEFLKRWEDRHGSIYFYQACAFGQQAHDKLRKDPGADITQESRNAREAIDKALALSREEWLPRVKNLLNAAPKSDDDDDDLIAFKGRPEFQDIL